MRLLTQPNRWSCLPTAFAMILEVNIEDIFSYLGHDGSEIVWPNEPEPLKRRAFNIQEMVTFCYSLGFAVIGFDVFSQSSLDVRNAFDNLEKAIIDKSIFGTETAFRRLKQRLFKFPGILSKLEGQNILNNNHGVLLGSSLNGSSHAVAWDGVTICDPVGMAISKSNFQIKEFWAICEMKYPKSK